MFSIPPEHVTIGEAFQDAGYRTRIISKWHQDRASLARSFAGGDRIMGLGAYRQFQRAYRKGPYKLIEYVRAKDFTKQSGEFESGSRVTQLFNVRRDPWETTDLSFLPESRELVASLREAMRDGRVRDLLQIAFCVGIALNLRRAFRGEAGTPRPACGGVVEAHRGYVSSDELAPPSPEATGGQAALAHPIFRTFRTRLRERAGELGDNRESTGEKYDFWSHY